MTNFYSCAFLNNCHQRSENISHYFLLVNYYITLYYLLFITSFYYFQRAFDPARKTAMGRHIDIVNSQDFWNEVLTLHLMPFLSFMCPIVFASCDTLRATVSLFTTRGT